MVTIIASCSSTFVMALSAVTSELLCGTMIFKVARRLYMLRQTAGPSTPGRAMTFDMMSQVWKMNDSWCRAKNRLTANSMTARMVGWEEDSQ